MSIIQPLEKLPGTIKWPSKQVKEPNEEGRYLLTDSIQREESTPTPLLKHDKNKPFLIC